MNLDLFMTNFIKLVFSNYYIYNFLSFYLSFIIIYLLLIIIYLLFNY